MARTDAKARLGLDSVPCTAEEFARHDVVVVSTAHKQFRDPALYARVELVVDTRDLMAPLGSAHPARPAPRWSQDLEGSGARALPAPRVLVDVPTYDERDNVAPLVPRAAAAGRDDRRRWPTTAAPTAPPTRCAA